MANCPWTIDVRGQSISMANCPEDFNSIECVLNKFILSKNSSNTRNNVCLINKSL